MFSKLSLVNKISLFIFYTAFLAAVAIMGYFIFWEQSDVDHIFLYVSLSSCGLLSIGYICYLQNIFKNFTKLNYLFSAITIGVVFCILTLSGINFFFNLELFYPILGLCLSIYTFSFFSALSTGQICFKS